MKKLFSIAVLLLLTVSIASLVSAQKQKTRDELLKEIATLSNSQNFDDKQKAYELSKEFVTRFAKDKEVAKVKNYIKGFPIMSFFKASDDARFADFFRIGKEIMSQEPDNTEVALNLGYGGYAALLKKQDKSFAEDSVKYAKLTLELMEKGNVPASYAPFNTKEDALAWMHYLIGFFTMEKDSKEAAASFYKSTLYETAIKQTSQPYLATALYYEDRYEAMSKDLKAKANSLSDAEFKAASDKVNVILEQMMDAYARASKNGEAEKNPASAGWKTRLKQVYLFMKKPETAFDSYLTYILSTPFKDPSTF